MKKTLLTRVRNEKTLGKAWTAVRKNGRLSKSEQTREEVAQFEANAIEKIGKIRRQLQNGRFRFLPSIGKKILKKDKKNFRPLVIAPIESRIVQRAVHDVLVDIPALQSFVKTPYSFGGIRKGENDNLSAVPAAIKSVLDAIGNGSIYVVRSDISDFFTGIPKSHVTKIIGDVVDDEEFLKLFSEAIKVELENMSRLRSQDVNRFPIEDLGVAQGNSLSPLLGNLYLHDFDKTLNGAIDIRCIRYIDDFIILAPNKSAAENHFSKACHILQKLGLSVSDKKTIRGTAQTGFEFLGIQIQNGFIRPSKESRDRLIDSIDQTLRESKDGFNAYGTNEIFDKRLTLLQTLRRVSGVMQGWQKHYWFCNDATSLTGMNKEINRLIKDYLKHYQIIRNASREKEGWPLLGIDPFTLDAERKFVWPTPTHNSLKQNI